MSSNCFICQRCKQPLKWKQSPTPLDTPGLSSAEESETGDVASAQCEPEAGEGCSGSAQQASVEGGQEEAVPGDASLLADQADHFILLGEFDSRRTLHTFQKMTADIFDILSGDKAIDHPVCEECTDRLLEALDTSVSGLDSDNHKYKSFLESGASAPEHEPEALRRALRALEREEASLVQEFQELEKNLEKGLADLDAAQAETQVLEQQELRDQNECSELEAQQSELQDELLSVEHRLKYARKQEAQLQKIDIFSHTFEIWQDGPIGTINQIRLGRLPSVPVSWQEINAAWGQTALLLLALAKTVGLQFQRYQLVPGGSHSYLMTLTPSPMYLPLFWCGQNDIWLCYKFDRAMVAFLDCMQQFKTEAEKGEVGLHWPYKVHDKEGLLEDPANGGKFYSIRTHMNSEEQWTHALKLMLTNFKWTLAWVSLRHHQK